MFVSLADKRVAEYYRNGLGYTPDREIVALLLENLSKKIYAEKLSAVTSIGRLSITTALSWDDSKNDSVSIDSFKDAGKNLIILSYHSNGRRTADAGRRCSLEEAFDYADLYVMKLLLVKYGEL
ncbi:MAG TPA: hypothetical protein PKY59_10650 [Pyrinomonadaceae bacterium]|nr:hypothetical protein [Pyrinomonadaceae bacterium]